MIESRLEVLAYVLGSVVLVAFVHRLIVDAYDRRKWRNLTVTKAIE